MTTRKCSQNGKGEWVECGRDLKSRRRCKKHYQQWLTLQPKCRASGCRRIKAGHYYCRIHEPLALLTRPLARQEETLARFSRNIEPDWDTGCWLWEGALNENGYGQFQAKGTWLTHRFGFAWFIGGHAPRQVLDHLCNRRTCVRPDHLWAISNTLNVKLQYYRELKGNLPYWQDSRGIHDTMRMDAWAKGHGLPYGESAPFGRDGVVPPVVEAVDLVPHLSREARLRHPAWDNSQHKRVRPITVRRGDYGLAV